jgi:COMPASS component SWD3
MNEEFGRPISHIALSPISRMSSAEAYDDNPSFLAVNSYDNVLRVYDRADEQAAKLKQVQALTGQTAKNWSVVHPSSSSSSAGVSNAQASERVCTAA